MIKDKKFLIVGLGLLGGSIALGLKKWNHTVYAIDIDENTIQYALKNHMIDEGSTTCDPNLLNKADVIISGLYPTMIIDWINENQKHFRFSEVFSYRSNKKLQTKNIAIKTKNKTIIQVGAANMILIPNTITTIIANGISGSCEYPTKSALGLMSSLSLISAVPVLPHISIF